MGSVKIYVGWLDAIPRAAKSYVVLAKLQRMVGAGGRNGVTCDSIFLGVCPKHALRKKLR